MSCLGDYVIETCEDTTPSINERPENANDCIDIQNYLTSAGYVYDTIIRTCKMDENKNVINL